MKKLIKVPLIFLYLALLACSHQSRQSTINAAFITVNATRDAYVQYDAAQQDKIVKEATSLDDGKTKLAEYRAKRVKLLALFPVAYASIRAAYAANDDLSLKNMNASLKQLLDTVLPLIGGAL